MINRFFSSAILFAAGLIVTLSPASAQVRDHKTTLNIPYAVQVNSTVIQPGKYMIEVVHTADSASLVEVRTADGMKVVATVHTVPVLRDHPTETTEFWFAKTDPGKPRVVRAWFTPGELEGREGIGK